MRVDFGFVAGHTWSVQKLPRLLVPVVLAHPPFPEPFRFANASFASPLALIPCAGERRSIDHWKQLPIGDRVIVKNFQPDRVPVYGCGS
jgi:hypothetical protein